MAFLDKLMRSHVFTDIERKQVGNRVSSEDAAVVSKAIEWAQEQIETRKAQEEATG